MDSIQRKPKRGGYGPHSIRGHASSRRNAIRRGLTSEQKSRKNISLSHAPSISQCTLPAKRPLLRLPHTKQSTKNNLKRNAPRWLKKTLWWLFLAVVALVLFASVAFGFLFWKASSATESAIVSEHRGSIVKHTAKYIFHTETDESDLATLRGAENGRINILLLGKPGKNFPGQNLTDTIIIASINTETGQTALMSLPRDMYVNIPETSAYTKLNALYYYGRNDENQIDIVSKTLEEITNLPIHYFLVVDYDGFTRIVDALGGINLDVEQDIHDTRFPGPNYSYETFELPAGFHHLDGKTALKYVRERHSDPMGDFGRSHKQQKVIQAVKNRANSIGTFFDPITLYKLLDTLEETIKTNITLDEMESFAHLIQNIDTQNINTFVVDAWRRESLLRVSHVWLDNGQRMFALVPRTGTYTEIRDTAENIFEQNILLERQTRIQEESSSVGILNYSGEALLAGKVHALLEDLKFEGGIDILSQTNEEPLPKTYVQKNSSAKKTYSLDELLKKVPASITIDPLDFYMPKEEDVSRYDFLLFLGEDIVDSYDWEEGSVEEYLRSRDEDKTPNN